MMIPTKHWLPKDKLQNSKYKSFMRLMAYIFSTQVPISLKRDSTHNERVSRREAYEAYNRSP